MNIKLDGTVIIVGSYGCGKTEVAINLAVKKKYEGIKVRVIDLDLVNTYFRTREAKEQLNNHKIDIILPIDEYLYADLPILNPKIYSLLRTPSELTIIDAGGDEAGTKVIGSLGDLLKAENIRMLQVINLYRPDTETIDKCLKIKNKIEKSSKLKINGIIGNTNLIEDTKIEHIYKGYDFVKKYSLKLGIDIEFITIPNNIISDIDLNKFEHPILPIARQLVPPWIKPEKLNI